METIIKTWFTLLLLNFTAHTVVFVLSQLGYQYEVMNVVGPAVMFFYIVLFIPLPFAALYYIWTN